EPARHRGDQRAGMQRARGRRGEAADVAARSETVPGRAGGQEVLAGVFTFGLHRPKSTAGRSARATRPAEERVEHQRPEYHGAALERGDAHRLARPEPGPDGPED